MEGGRLFGSQNKDVAAGRAWRAFFFDTSSIIHPRLTASNAACCMRASLNFDHRPHRQFAPGYCPPNRKQHANRPHRDQQTQPHAILFFTSPQLENYASAPNGVKRSTNDVVPHRVRDATDAIVTAQGTIYIFELFPRRKCTTTSAIVLVLCSER